MTSLWANAPCTTSRIPSRPSENKCDKLFKKTLLLLRQEFTNTSLIGNANENWQVLNGELNEGWPEQMLKEVALLATTDQHAFSLNTSVAIDLRCSKPIASM